MPLRGFIFVKSMQLKVEVRDKFGKAVKALRAEGMVPAELYGHGTENQHLAINAKEFDKVFKAAGENTVIDFTVNGKAHKALIHKVDRNFLHDTVEHVDLYEVRMDEKTRVPVPIELVGEAPAVKALGGILNRTMSEVEVEALPGDLPQKFEVDLSGLTELNQSIYIKELSAPKGVKILTDPEAVIVTITPPLKEEEPVPAAPADVTAVKVETEEKKAEREKEKAAEGTEEKK